MLADREFSRQIYYLTLLALVIPPGIGGSMMALVGIYPMPEFYSVFRVYSGVYLLVFLVAGGFAAQTAARAFIALPGLESPLREQAAMRLLRPFPLYLLSFTTLYSIGGALSADFSLQYLGLRHYAARDHLISMFGLIPVILITIFPIYFYFNDLLGRYLAPRGILVISSPMGLKMLMLGLVTPIMVDTVLLNYFVSRFGVFGAEILALWLALIAVAGIGAYLAWKSYRQGMQPLENFILGAGSGPASGKLQPQSLDELGMLAGRWAEQFERQEHLRHLASESARRADAAFRQTAVGMALLSPDGRFLDVNQALCGIAGYAREELLSLSFRDVTHPEELAMDEWVVRQLLEGKIRNFTFEKRHIRKDGSVTPISLTVNLIRDHQDRPDYFITVIEDITERKRVEQAVQAGLLRLNEAQRIAKVGNWELDLHSGEFFWSDEVYRILEIADAQIGASYQTFLGVVHPDDRELVNSAYQKSLADHLPYELIHRLLMADGRVKWVNIRCHTLFSADGAPLITKGTCQDITERKLAERKAVEREISYRSVIEASSDSFWLVDVHGRFLEVSENYALRSGYSREELLTMHISDVEALEGEAEVAERIRQIVRDKNALFESRHRAKNGEIWPVEVSTVHVPISGGRIFAFIRDISERKRVEITLRASEASLREAQKLAKIGSWVLNLESLELVWSEEVYRIFEIDPSVSPSYEIFLQVVHPEDRMLVNDTYFASVRDRCDFNLVHRLLMPDGRVKHVHERGESYYREERAIRSIGAVQDITQAKLAEEELRQYREQLETMVKKRTTELEAVNQELEAFAYSVSHDLRAPLRGIDGFSLALLEDYADKLDETGLDYLHRVRAASQRMGSLIDELLKLSRITRATLKPSPVDLSGLAELVVKELRDNDPGHAADIMVKPGAIATGDAGLLKIVLENLLGNAWKYSYKSPAPRIGFACLDQDGETVYAVSDNGAGFDMRYAGKLFGAFQRLHHQGQFEGNGIGLATVKRIILRHGGRIWAESQPGESTVFYFTLPDRDKDPEPIH